MLVAYFIVVDRNQLVGYLSMVMVMLKCLKSPVVHHLVVWLHLRHNVHHLTMVLLANHDLDLLYCPWLSDIKFVLQYRPDLLRTCLEVG